MSTSVVPWRVRTYIHEVSPFDGTYCHCIATIFSSLGHADSELCDEGGGGRLCLEERVGALLLNCDLPRQPMKGLVQRKVILKGEYRGRKLDLKRR